MSRSILNTMASSLLLLLALASCSSAPALPTFPKLSWTYLPPINLDVAQVSVDDQYQPPMQPPNVEHLFPLIPAKAMRDWATDRLHAAGRSGEAIFVIKQAKAVEASLPTQGGVQGYFTDQQSSRYDLTLVAELNIHDPNSQRSGHVRAEASLSRTVAQSTTLNEREKVWYEMVDTGMKALNSAMESQINEQLGQFVVR